MSKRLRPLNPYPNPSEELISKIEEIKDPEFVIYAVWALGKLREFDTVRKFVKDTRSARF